MTADGRRLTAEYPCTGAGPGRMPAREQGGRCRFLRQGVVLWTLAASLSTSIVWNSAFAQGTLSLVIHDVEAAYSPGRGGYQVTAFVSVVDAAGMPVAGLAESSFVVREDGVPIDSFEVQAARGGIDLLLAIDTSGSMAAEGKMKAVKAAVAALLQTLGDEDRVGLISFNAQPKVEINLTHDYAAVRNFVDLLEAGPGTGTCLWDAAFEAVELASASKEGRRAALLLTDGVDELPAGGPCSRKPLQDVIDLAGDPTIRVPVYTVGIGGRVAEEDLARLAELTGGRASLARKTGEVTELFRVLGLQLRGSYTIVYASQTTSGEHSLFIQVQHQGAQDQDARKFRAAELPAQATFGGIEDGQVVREDLTLSVEVRGDRTPARVEFYLDDEEFSEDPSTPFEAVWETAGQTPGLHALRAVVYAASGEVLAEAEIQVVYEEPILPTATPPSVSVALEGLQAGQIVKGPTELTASVDRQEAVGRVAFVVDGFPIDEDDAPPFTVLWEPELLDPGEHALSAVAYGPDGHEVARDTVRLLYQRPFPWGVVLGGSLGVLALACGGFLVLRRKRAARRLSVGLAPVSAMKPGLPQMAGQGERTADRSLAVLTIEACQDVNLVGQRFEIWEQEVLIGRAESCSIIIPVQPVSRIHAAIRLGGAGEKAALTVDDLVLEGAPAVEGESALPFRIYDGQPHTPKPSAFGAYVDNVRVTPGDGLPLRHGCRVRLGRPITEGRVAPVILRFEDLRQAARDPVDADLTSDEIVAPRVPAEPSTEVAPAGGVSLREKEGDEPRAAEPAVEEETAYETEDFELSGGEESERETQPFDAADEGQGNG